MLQEEEREEMCQQRGVQTAFQHHGNYEQPKEAGVCVSEKKTIPNRRTCVVTLVVILSTFSSGHSL